MLVSVVVPVYNGLPFLSEAMASILAQVADMEIIVSDDCSRDASLDYVRSLKDPRIKIIENTQNMGIFGNLNRCLSDCKGQYIQIFCQDDIMKPGYLSSQIALLERYPEAGLVYGSHSIIDDNSQQIAFVDNDTTPELISRPLYRWIASHYGSLPASLSSVMLRRRTLETIGFFDSSYRVAGDLEYYNRVSERFLVARNCDVLHLVRSHIQMTSKAKTTGAAYLSEEYRLQAKMHEWWAPRDLIKVQRYRANARGRYHIGWILRSASRGQILEAARAIHLLSRMLPLHWVLMWRIRSVLFNQKPLSPFVRAPTNSPR